MALREWDDPHDCRHPSGKQRPNFAVSAARREETWELSTATTKFTLMTRVRVVAVAIVVLATPGLLMRWLVPEPAHESSALTGDTTPATRVLEAARKAWVDELDELAASIRTRAVADDTYEFVARPNIPYVLERFPPERLVAERIDTVLIINDKGKPLFWRRVNDRENRGFEEADEFLAGLPRLSAPGAPGEPALAGAARFARGPSLVVAMPIYPASRTGPARGWLFAARALDAAQWRRYAERAHVDVEALDPRTSEWPADAMYVAGKPPVPVLRVEPNGIRGWLPVYDVNGQRLQLISVAVAKRTAPVERIAPPKTHSLWLWGAALLAGLVGVLLLGIRRRRGAIRFDPSAPRPTITTPRPVASATRSAPALETHDAPDLEATFDAGDLASPAPTIDMEQAGTGSALVPAPAAPAPAAHEPAAPAPAEDNANRLRDRQRERLAAATWVLRYQLQVEVRSDRIEGVEALLYIAEGGKERPATEIIAESAGLELEVSERWLREACRARLAWSHEVDCEFPVCIPVSLPALEDAAFLPVLRGILEDCGLAPRHLELDVPEAALTNSAVALRALQEARRAGVLICIDDLSTGSSSLRSLTVVPIAKVRIDAALIRDAGHDPTASAFVRAIIGAASALRIVVCATGVDSAELAVTVAAHGRLLAQGAALAPPMDGEQFLAALRRRDVDTAKLPILQVGDPARNESGRVGSPRA
jgi:EAL domain-containing protein (putative c-di-GMP-specific phosphodiesterase class I)/sensor domain CHASE-containing protein